MKRGAKSGVPKPITTADGVLIRANPGDMRDLKGIIPKPARAVTVAAMNRALSRMGR